MLEETYLSGTVQTAISFWWLCRIGGTNYRLNYGMVLRWTETGDIKYRQDNGGVQVYTTAALIFGGSNQFGTSTN